MPTERRQLVDQPYTVEGSVNQRLKWARNNEGVSLDEWCHRLSGPQYEVARSTVSKYERIPPPEKHPSQSGDSRLSKRRRGMPPFDYLARVHEVFEYRLEWLAFGTGDPKPPAKPPRVAEGALMSFLREVGRAAKPGGGPASSSLWAKGDLIQFELLTLLQDAKTAVKREPGDGEGEHLSRLVAYLDALLPEGDASLASLADLELHERQHVALHIRGLAYLLFRPFRASKATFLRSRAATKMPTPPAAATDESEEPHPTA